MSHPDVRQPTMVTMRSKVWLEELTLELTRLGHPQDQAERAARTMLVHIVSRASWPRDVFLAPDEPLEAEP